MKQRQDIEINSHYVCNHVSVHFLSPWGLSDTLLQSQLPSHAKIMQSETKPGL